MHGLRLSVLRPPSRTVQAPARNVTRTHAWAQDLCSEAAIDNKARMADAYSPTKGLRAPHMHAWHAWHAWHACIPAPPRGGGGGAPDRVLISAPAQQLARITPAEPKSTKNTGKSMDFMFADVWLCLYICIYMYMCYMYICIYVGWALDDSGA